MKTDFITFRSITPAQHAQRVLHQGGIDASLQRTPRQIQQHGCGYCLRVRQMQLAAAVQALRAAGVPFQKVYTMENGLQEVQM